MISAGHGPTIVLVHGVGDNAAGWADLIQALSPHHRVVAVDQRGHGFAPRFEQFDDPFGQLVDDLIAVLDDEGPALVIGHSMGGAVAAEAAIKRPELFRGLVLEDPAWIDRPREELELIGQARVLSKEMDLKDLPRAIAGKMSEGWSNQEALAWGMAHFQTQREFLETGVVAQERPWKEVQGDLKGAAVPAVVFVGSGQGAIVDKQELALPYVEFPGAGHCIRRERPQEFLQSVAQFMRDAL
ncbi:alpha/beta hydrolase [Corynebacterium breve]|uniref:Alpha/beta hydrolase n=1 Tax=Corynebacterium breve TaxID=3049799 RepID=A0ABY8VIE8_9CORY|nr:alpha/beta hydrolase [Corynebacterium breve]WIM67340.1 alpha/beta hydrolase [Corynebacterium breve]